LHVISRSQLLAALSSVICNKEDKPYFWPKGFGLWAFGQWAQICIFAECLCCQRRSVVLRCNGGWLSMQKNMRTYNFAG